MRQHVLARAGLAALALAGSAAILLNVAGMVAAQGNTDKASATKIKVAAQATKPDASGNQVITLTVDIDKGWHIYANPVQNDKLAGTDTEVTITCKGKQVPAKIVYPQGTQADVSGVGKHRIYEGRVAIQATVQRTEGASPLEVTVTVNACDDNNCLPLGERKLSVP